MRCLLILLAILLFTPLAVSFAEEVKFPQPTTQLSNKLITEPGGVVDFIGVIANWIFTLFIVIAVIYLLLAAFQYRTSAGGEGVAVAPKMLLYAAIAIAIAVLARSIVFVVRKLVDDSTSLTPKTTQTIAPYETIS